MSRGIEPLLEHEIAELAADRGCVRFARGDEIVADSGEVLVLLEGELLHYRENRLLDVAEAPKVLGLAEVLARAPLPDRFQARTDGRLARISGERIRSALAENPALRDRVLQHLAQAAVGHARDRLDFARAFDDFFAPGPGGRILPGPYRFGPYRATQLLMDASPADVDALLPAGLSRVPGFGGRYLIVVNDLRGCVCEHPASDGRAFEYQEIVPFVPCISRSGAAGLYTPELYPNAYMPILLGREVYGFPKRMARVRLGERRVDLFADNTVLLHARWDREVPVTAGELLTGLTRTLLPSGDTFAPLGRVLDALLGLAERAGVSSRPLPACVFVQKRIRKADSLRLDDDAIDQLVKIPFVVTHLSDPIRLEGVSVVAHPASRVFPGHVLAGFSCSLGFRMEAGHVEHDHSDKPSRRGLLGRLPPGTK